MNNLPFAGFNMLNDLRLPTFTILLSFLLAFVLGCSGKEERAAAEQTITSREDSLMAVLSAAKASASSGTSILRVEQIDSLAAESEAMEKDAERTSETALKAAALKIITKAQTRLIDTVSTLEEAIKRNAALQVDSGSAEDLRLDSLMRLTNQKSLDYQRYLFTHTHKSLAAAAHQDIAKQARLLRSIAAKSDQRAYAASKAKFDRIQRQREIQGLPPLPDTFNIEPSVFTQ